MYISHIHLISIVAYWSLRGERSLRGEITYTFKFQVKGFSHLKIFHQWKKTLPTASYWKFGSGKLVNVCFGPSWSTEYDLLKGFVSWCRLEAKEGSCRCLLLRWWLTSEPMWRLWEATGWSPTAWTSVFWCVTPTKTRSVTTSSLLALQNTQNQLEPNGQE